MEDRRMIVPVHEIGDVDGWSAYGTLTSYDSRARFLTASDRVWDER